MHIIFEQPFLSPENLGRYADSIHAHGFGFINGTVRRITRPNQNQRTMYNGCKRDHAMKFQSVVVPDGLIANLSGPYEGKRHDSTMLCQFSAFIIIRATCILQWCTTLSLIMVTRRSTWCIHLHGPPKDRQCTPRNGIVQQGNELSQGVC